MTLFRKKPVVIEAVQFDGSYESRIKLLKWAGPVAVYYRHTNALAILTLEGSMTVSPGDWVIRGVAGEFYPCKPDIFEATYERLV